MDWEQERDAALQAAACIVVKVGSTVLSDGSALIQGVLDNLVAQLATLQAADSQKPRRVILVSSGAVAAGRTAVASQKAEEANNLAARQALASIGQSRLMHFYDQAFAQRGVLTSQILLTRDDLRNRTRFLNVRNTFSTLLDWHVIPVVNENDTVSVNELKFSDNDNLASLLLNTVEADLFINLTTIGGVLDANPQICVEANILPCIERVRDLDLNTLCGGKTTLGTGGMYSKLLSAARAAQLGVPTLILPGREPNVITRAFAGEKIGTWIRPEERTISRRKYWLAYQSEPCGTLEIDAGAATALRKNGKSLLSAGIIGVHGDFPAGFLVKIVYDGVDLGVGLSNYPAETLREIQQLSREEVARRLGDAHYPEAIHRDNMLLNAAL